MNRFSIILGQFICLLVLTFSTSIVTAGLTNEELRQLLIDNEMLTSKVAQLEAKIARLELLELDVQHIKSFLINLLPTDQSNPTSITDQLSKNIAGKNNAILRTCRETRAANPFLSSGMYWIDPDGQGVGDDPIYVYCDMSSGFTAVLHDSESQMDVGHCADPGCYSRAIAYNSSMRQMSALAELSNECHQSIRYDCNFAPFEMGGVTYAWWNDRTGNPRYFWSGSNSSVHTCQCGMDHNCVENNMLCNCDSSAPVALTDSGVITDKNILPITRLNFGRTQLESSSGAHTLGRFECSGQVAVNGMPTSCADLWRTGYSLSGLYSVMGANMVESVYCDFTKLPQESKFQTWIGYVDVKSSPVYFDVQRSSNFNLVNTPIPFQFTRLNIGGAMDIASGTFTAKRTGKYFFSLSGTCAMDSGGYIGISLKLNGNYIGMARCDNPGHAYYGSFSLDSTLQLQADDKVWSEIKWRNDAPYLRDDGDRYTHFTGWLLQEELRIN